MIVVSDFKIGLPATVQLPFKPQEGNNVIMRRWVRKWSVNVQIPPPFRLSPFPPSSSLFFLVTSYFPTIVSWKLSCLVSMDLLAHFRRIMIASPRISSAVIGQMDRLPVMMFGKLYKGYRCASREGTFSKKILP